MKAEGIGLYIHIPFCKKKCNYCDFCSYPNISESVRTSYIKRLCEEISEYKKEPKIKLEKVFFGGGTPTLLTASELMEIWRAVLDTFDTGSVSEFTLEANPGTVTREILSAFSDIGANRISIGLQSIHENELKKLGRIHTCEDFLASFELAREYFDNVSLDVMYGIAEQSVESFKRTLDFVSSLPVTHLSVYGLIIEEGTPFCQARTRSAICIFLPQKSLPRRAFLTMKFQITQNADTSAVTTLNIGSVRSISELALRQHRILEISGIRTAAI